MKETQILEQVRAPKNKKELGNIIKAQRISETVLKIVLLNLRVGVSEIEIATLIKKSFIKLGAPILSFPPIVAFGKNSANIHHNPGKSKLKKGDIVMLDFGCTVNQYCSDMTRTYFFGEPSKKGRKIYNDVLHAMELAMKKIAKGEKRAKVVDKAARGYLNKKYGKNNFLHGLGHGVGTVIHEWPNFKPKSEDIVPVGTVMTIEPGLYFKGFGGVRIEDMILITQNGYQNLTNAPKDIESAILR